MLSAAKRLARLIAMVVLPDPPFGLTTSVVFILIRGFNPLFLSVDPASYAASIILRVAAKSNCRLRSAFHRDADVSDDLGEFLRVGGDERAERLGRARGANAFLLDQLLLQLRAGERLHCGRLDRLHHRQRNAARG